jgi:hypothetical protein
MKHGRASVKLPRLSIGNLMVIVVAAAINLAIGRFLGAYIPIMLTAVALTALVFQAASVALVRCRGRTRAFWAGFLAFGLMAMLTVIWAIVFAPKMGIALDPATGETIDVKIPGSLKWYLWASYIKFVEMFLANQLQLSVDPMSAPALRIWSLPQLLIASTLPENVC